MFKICYTIVVLSKHMRKRRESFMSQYINFPYITRETMCMSAEALKIPTSTLNSYIYRSVRDSDLVHLKRNYYVTRDFFEKNRTDSQYKFFIANVLLKPSYISLETALQYYGLYAEAVNYAVTSITTKTPRSFKNASGVYYYRNMTKKLFTGFETVKEKFEFTIALPHKALFDYLYFYTFQFTRNIHPNILEELRIDTSLLSEEEKRRFTLLVARYTSIKICV